MASTSVPRWPIRSLPDIEFESRARHHLIFVTDPDASAHVAANAAALPHPATVVDVYGSPTPDVAIHEALVEARVGWRFVVIGAGAEVTRVRALIVAAGAVDAEIEVVHLGGGDGFAAARRDVFCAHCHTVTPAVAKIGQTMVCAGCGAPLVIYHHFSHRQAAYLGYRPDAEELSDSEALP